ncbi:hypothetical protein QFZ34_002201 [Phyllobacterium ifriqiyense]|uniref:AbiJ N-terminal domain-containing protein n=1 Tax=Phyllobacterium ifriqiyense TaxID=314238 RepID=A0ABU0S8E3_9HYPH|nr:hypothetical protein [Phyllobacterium ifriqiyense]MDQ0997019.1 hypothetical protein [Phyllobacterium ifriqiyense]
MYVDASTRKKVLALKDVAVKNFTQENWLELGTLTGCYDIVRSHSRLLRSLSFGDDDYAGCALEVLMRIVEQESANFLDIERYIFNKFGGGGETISSAMIAGPKVYFQPAVFNIPSELPDPFLVSAMMPFSGSFSGTYNAIKEACKQSQMKCERADNIWKESAVIQDIFGLIYRSFIVICDFTGKNPNVFYEAGIAHTLGKHVIPITQSAEDIPFDLRHHRYLQYLNNGEGLEELTLGLSARLKFLHIHRDEATSHAAGRGDFD